MPTLHWVGKEKVVSPEHPYSKRLDQLFLMRSAKHCAAALLLAAQMD